MSAARRGERNARFNCTARGCLPTGRVQVYCSALQVSPPPLGTPRAKRHNRSKTECQRDDSSISPPSIFDLTKCVRMPTRLSPRCIEINPVAAAAWSSQLSMATNVSSVVVTTRNWRQTLHVVVG
jgi:hypothetical protein